MMRWIETSRQMMAGLVHTYIPVAFAFRRHPELTIFSLLKADSIFRRCDDPIQTSIASHDC